MDESSGEQAAIGCGGSPPIFQTDGFDDIDETSTHGAYVGGMAGAHEDAGIATNYMRAAEMLVERALVDDRVHEVVLPVLFLYRHALELRLKFAGRPAKLDHNLGELAGELDVLLLKRSGTGLPRRLMDRVAELAKVDPRADAFRFTRKSRKGSPREAHFADEVWVNLAHLRDEMSWIDKALQAAADLVRS